MYSRGCVPVIAWVPLNINSYYDYRSVQINTLFLIFMPLPLGAENIMFSGCPSVCPSQAWNNLFSPVHGSVGPSDQPWPFYGMSVRPTVCSSVRPERFPGICRRTHWGNGMKFCMLMYLGCLQNLLIKSHSLLIYLILLLFWFSEMVKFGVTGHYQENA